MRRTHHCHHSGASTADAGGWVPVHWTALRRDAIVWALSPPPFMRMVPAEPSLRLTPALVP